VKLNRRGLFGTLAGLLVARKVAPAQSKLETLVARVKETGSRSALLEDIATRKPTTGPPASAVLIIHDFSSQGSEVGQWAYCMKTQKMYRWDGRYWTRTIKAKFA
jgi:hypothetical protein